MSHPLIDMEYGGGQGTQSAGAAAAIDMTPHTVAILLVGALLVLVALNRIGFRFTYGAGVSAGRGA